MTDQVLIETNFKELPSPTRGKVRDIFDLGKELVLVTTDRLSAFDVILPDPIPGKGKVLTGISEYWFRKFANLIPNHLLTTDINMFPKEFRPFADILEGRSMFVRKTEPLPIEAIVRGYISGSGWEEYLKTGMISGIPLPIGMIESQKFGQAIFTPSTKAEAGHHDVNIDIGKMSEIIGVENTILCWAFSIMLFEAGLPHAETNDIIIADTKFEFGLLDGKIVLIDEVLTPDSSRFWSKPDYKPGGPQSSFDKQFVRDYLSSLDWNKQHPAPKLPQEIINKTQKRYWEAYNRIVLS